jgi:hypothetical protein
VHKLAPRSLPCIFLGYPADTKGYRCYDPESRRVLTSRHVSFDESCFPFRLLTSPRPAGDVRAVAQPDPVLMPVPERSRPRHAPTRRGQESAPAQRGHESTAAAADDMPASSAASPVAPTPAAARASGPRSMVAAPDGGIVASSVDPSSTATAGSPSASSAPAPPPTTPRRPPPQPHHMMTRSRTGHLRPNPRYALAADTSTLADVPSSVRMAVRDPEWCDAMRVEFDALQANRTWTLVP